MSALLAILGYGLAVGAAGLLLAARERSIRRKSRTTVGPGPSSPFAQTLHGRLKTDAGEEMGVYFHSASK
jgi:hypothetical protein